MPVVLFRWLRSYNMIVPFSCSGDPGDTAYDRYRKIQGKRDGVDGVGLPLTRLHEIHSNNIEQVRCVLLLISDTYYLLQISY
jgi:hypothetical protein